MGMTTQQECAAWNCTCQGASDNFDLYPRHWGTASTNRMAREFWVRRHCQTQPTPMGPPPTVPIGTFKPASWGGFGYFYEVHSRWYACYLHYADVKSGSSLVSPTLPIIDDEYNEQVAVYQSGARTST